MEIKNYISAEIIQRSLTNTPQITFEVTDACNLDCVYCGYGKLYSDYDNRENKALDIEKAKNLLNYLISLWNSPLNISTHNSLSVSFYGGEPLLNFSFIEKLVKYTKNLKSKHRQFVYNMTTNGMLLHKYIDFLVENDFRLLISLDGTEQNNSYRINKKGGDSFRQVIANVNWIKSKYPDYFLKRINFNAVLHNRNSVNDIYDFFKRNYNKIARIGALNDTGIRDDKKDEFIKMYQNVTDSLMQSEN